MFVAVSFKLLAFSCKPEIEPESPMSIFDQLTMAQLTVDNSEHCQRPKTMIGAINAQRPKAKGQSPARVFQLSQMFAMFALFPLFALFAMFPMFPRTRDTQEKQNKRERVEI
jgi:hypothetical protein